uniref:uncharacterized protein rnf180a n=1 Tax=Monopterus albus TaxID=43700 RepID=UPI0009B3151B|nr:uncharacterized protein LOC109956673 [Monopterus albus]
MWLATVGLKSTIMSFCLGATCVNGSSRIGGCGTQDPGKENSNNKIYTPCLNIARPRLESVNPAGEGRSSSVEQLVRPASLGREARKKTYGEDNRRRWRERNQERDGKRRKAEHVGNMEKRKQRQRKPGLVETHGDEVQERPGRGSTERLSSSNSDIQLKSSLEVEGSNNLQRGHECPSAQSPPPALRSKTSALPPSPIQTRSMPLSHQRLSFRTAEGDLLCCPFSSYREPDPFWVKVRTGATAGQSPQSHHPQKHITCLTSSELGVEEEWKEEEEEEEQDMEDSENGGSGVMEVMSQTMTLAVVPPCVPFGEKRMSKKEKNRRRGQRRRERWRQSQQLESRQKSMGNSSSNGSSGGEDDESVNSSDREGYTCTVCLDVYFSPHMCHPCNHIFCEPCLRTLARSNPTNTPCPLCRTIITHVLFQKELSQAVRAFFPKEYLSRKRSFHKANCAKWPLPSCRKFFHVFGGFQRQSSPIAGRQFPHGGGYRLDAMDMVIIYMYSVNWVIGFFIFCFLCYLFFPSF